ncbi:MAG: hypothetical protein GF311_01525 [Candidatus Lokiarchaeota archaeon]|nr:hypothetical protein [Candidatus Lokiarchaeota archaeon]
MSEEISPQLNIALMRIARELGEDEDSKIYNLQLKGIFLPVVKVQLKGSRIFVDIRETFQEKRYYELLKIFRNEINYYEKCLGRNFFELINQNGEKFIKYSILIQSQVVDQNINIDLFESYNFKENDMNEDEWFNLQNSDEWKKAQIQVAREIISTMLLKRF